jgi:solute carrier family 35 protein E3
MADGGSAVKRAAASAEMPPPPAALAPPPPPSAAAPAPAAAGGGGGAASSMLSVIILILVNVSASTCLVGVNKWLVVGYGFRHVLLLSGLHFLVGWALMAAASSPSLGGARLFERKAVAPSLRASLPAAVAGLLSIVLMNYSLRTNSLGSYQMLKVAVLPATIALAAVQGARVGGVDVATAALVSAGTAVATVTDVDLTLGGSAVGLAAVLATAQYQVAQGAIQTQAELTSPQAMLAISPPQALLTLAASLLLETAWTERAGWAGGRGAAASPGELAALRAAGAIRAAGGAGGAWETPGAAAAARGGGGGGATPPPWPPADIWGHAYTLPELGLILLTCACAAALNYSGIALIGRINPIAFQFVNQLKTVLIVSVGFLVFAEAADATRVLSVATGLVCVISGIAWYTWHKQTQKKGAGK